MLRRYNICLIFLLLIQQSVARTWTSQAGSSIEADLITWRDDKVRLRSPEGQIMETAPSNLSKVDQEYLQGDDWLDEIYGTDTAEAINAFLNFHLFSGNHIWNEESDQIAQRLSWQQISKTNFMSSYQMRGSSGRRSRDELAELNTTSARTAFFFAQADKPKYFLVVYNNIKDVRTKPENQRHEEELREALDDRISETSKSIQQTMSNLLGNPTNQNFYNGRTESHRMLRWDFGDIAFLLSHDKGYSLSLYIHRADFTDRNGEIDFSKDERERWFTTNVEKRNNGDHVINNIPMVSQGDSGFCVPATFERYLRYIGIPIDMYTLAMLGETRIEGGTRVNKLRDETSRYLAQQGLRMRKMSSTLNIKRIAEYIDRGIPLIWTMSSTKTFNNIADDYTSERRGGNPKLSLPDKENFVAPHTLIITGYNQSEEAIAISDSWGPKYQERWIPLELAKQYDLAGVHVVDF